MDIEKLATAAVTTYISKTDCLSPFISEGDKEPSWDGNIYLYKNKLKRKDDCIGKVSVQVKGKYSTKLVKAKCKYHVEISDLRNYELHGAVYFVVLIDEKMDTYIYYNLFHPVDIKRILLRVGNQKGTNIEFSRAPSYTDITSIFINFNNDCDKQVSFVKSPSFTVLDIDKITEEQLPIKFSVSCSGKDISKAFDYIFTNEVFLYAKSPIDGYPDQPIDKVLVRQFGHIVHEKVVINKVTYFDEYTIRYSKDKYSLVFGKCIIIECLNGSSCFNINLNHSVKEQILALKFIIELLRKSTFNLGDKEFCLSNKTNSDINEFEDRLYDLQKIQNVLDILGVKEDLIIDYDEYKPHYYLLNILIKVLVNKEPYNNNEWDNIQRVNIKICNIYLPLIFIKGKNGESDTFINELTSDIDITLRFENGKELLAPLSILLGPKDYQSISSLYYEHIFKLLTSYGNEAPLIERINLSMLSMLLAYDKTSNKELLDVCISLSEWLLVNGESLPIEIRLLNKLQSIKRHRSLNSEEIISLQKIAQNYRKPDILTAVYLLLDERDKAKQYYKQIENKKNFKNYPIYSFMK